MTPESIEYYAPNPDDCWELQALDRLRGLLATNAFVCTNGTPTFYQGVVRQYPVTTALSKDAGGNWLPPAVALHAPASLGVFAKTLGGGAQGGRYQKTLQACLTLAFADDQRGDADFLAGLHRRAWNAAAAWQNALLQYPSDPLCNPGPLWHSLQLPASGEQGEGKPDIVHVRNKEQGYQVTLNFTMVVLLPRP